MAITVKNMANTVNTV